MKMLFRRRNVYRARVFFEDFTAARSRAGRERKISSEKFLDLFSSCISLRVIFKASAYAGIGCFFSSSTSSSSASVLFHLTFKPEKKKRGYTREKTMDAHDEDDAAIEKRPERDEMKRSKTNCAYYLQQRENTPRKKTATYSVFARFVRVYK